jgi:hypothetical protein
MRILLGAALGLMLAWVAPAGAVIIASETGTGNTTAPPDDPGFAHVVRRGGMSAVYIGDGWILTANHAKAGDVEFGGVTYRAVAGPGVRLLTDREYSADLLLFRIESDPGLPPLEIAASPPAGEVVMIGMGRNRGNPIYDWDPNPDLDGWYWGLYRAVRWGTNQVKDVWVEDDLGGFTWVFTVDFSELPGTNECQVAIGDSGGAVFSKNGDVWELTGIHLTRTLYDEQGQPTESALFGNESWSGQLSEYRDQILEIVAEPACADGMDDDGDGLVDHPDDPGCDDELDPFETSDALPCDDGFDGDGDGGTDFDPATYADPGSEITPPAGTGDPGCGSPTWSTESPECQDGANNDLGQDPDPGLVDYDGGQSIHGYCSEGVCPPGVSDPEADGVANPDPQCVGKPWKTAERKPNTCGLGAELALALPLLIWLRRRR